MTRAALSFLAAMLLSKLALADAAAPSASCFNGMDLFNVAKSHFWPATMFDYSLHGDVATDSEVTHLIESGDGYGMTTAGRLVAVAHTDRGGRVRIINARRATRKERASYEKG